MDIQSHRKTFTSTGDTAKTQAPLQIQACKHLAGTARASAQDIFARVFPLIVCVPQMQRGGLQRPALHP
eukprot:CAMPEP_0174343046 /NCGR_PEP_ID=MMETSP0810-20121108/26647_1 /TAXON_ID=73025 ORGANISM="Eutreptiella gymnastica-like, Strain CCMP1594" /NCGR_SAMPLE_ID=MMETSP0810 /ASSEMBLY_ACC=CAM_ASM_000659 /LENGTH=68 /DNA_ID=CAMNT_0015465545 /DNA_START=602 /DNA_END=808 /DNA_ORIENTATION=+